MKPAQFAHRAVTELVALGRAYRSPAPGLRILMYHAIGVRMASDPFGYYTVATDRFRRQLDVLCGSAAFAPVALDAAVESGMQAGTVLSFDDGYADNLRIAAPLLAERNIPFTVFVTSDAVREHHPGYLSPAELRELARHPGALIGAHGKHHFRLAQCDDRTLASELTGSKAALEDMLGSAVTCMSYPHGSVDARVRNAVELAGYTFAAGSRMGLNRPGQDPLLLNRTVIFGQDGMHFFKRKLGGFWDWPGRLRRTAK